MKKILSYIIPFTEKIESNINGTLELTLHNGKKVLDGETTNYSYGSLQRILEKALRKISIQKVQNSLLLGLGGGSVIDSLFNKFNYKGTIEAVELDEIMIEIAEKEYGIKANEKLKIFYADALKFVKEVNKKYDLIIVDLFIGENVPQQFLEKSFGVDLHFLMDKKGVVIFNIGIKTSAEKISDIVDYFKNLTDVELTILTKVEYTNTVLIIKKR